MVRAGVLGLFLACILAVGLGARPPHDVEPMPADMSPKPDNAELAMDFEQSEVILRGLFDSPEELAKKKRPKCYVSCDTAHIDASAEDKSDKGHPHKCWGDFKVFCKGDHGSFGVHCEGKFVAFETRWGARVALCEGALKHLAHVHVDHAGAELGIVKGAGCLGTAAVMMRLPDRRSNNGTEEESLEEDKVSLPFGMQWDSQMAPDMELAEREWEEDVDKKHKKKKRRGHETLVQAKCHGFGGHFKAVRISDGKRNDNVTTYPLLEAVINRSMETVSYPLLPESVPSEYTTPWSGPDMSGDVGLLDRRPDCEIRCNGHRLMWRGMPCWGRFTVHCTGRHPSGKRDDSHSEPHDSDDESVHRQLLEASEGAIKLKLHEGKDDEDDDDNKKRKSFKWDLDAACKGYFSGMFGGKCLGLTDERISALGYHKLSFCSGKHGMRFKHCGHGYAVGHWCQGQSLNAVLKDCKGKRG